MMFIGALCDFHGSLSYKVLAMVFSAASIYCLLCAWTFASHSETTWIQKEYKIVCVY